MAAALRHREMEDEVMKMAILSSCTYMKTHKAHKGLLSLVPLGKKSKSSDAAITSNSVVESVPINDLLANRDALGEVVRMIALHVTNKGVECKVASPIPMTVCTSIPVDVSFRHQVSFSSPDSHSTRPVRVSAHLTCCLLL